MSAVRRYRFPIIMLLVSAAVSISLPDRAGAIASNSLRNVKEMLSVLPPIFILLGLMDVWVPRETFVKYMGEGSGIMGVTLAIFLGAFAAGPLYGAFPIASMMFRKGVAFSNVMVLIGAWANLKMPMFLFETASLGARFSVTRWLVNIPIILAMSYVITVMLGANERERIVKRQFELERAATQTRGA
ncbi:MAG: permease [Bacillota bacterium]